MPTELEIHVESRTCRQSPDPLERPITESDMLSINSAEALSKLEAVTRRAEAAEAQLASQAAMSKSAAQPG
jgi:hypothetical protein